MNDDEIPETIEMFSVVLSSPDGKVTIQEDCDNTTIAIIDDDGRLMMYRSIIECSCNDKVEFCIHYVSIYKLYGIQPRPQPFQIFSLRIQDRKTICKHQNLG